MRKGPRVHGKPFFRLHSGRRLDIMSEYSVIIRCEMARPKSEEKRRHLLEAAAKAVGERGIGAPTALIAKMAGVAEGSLFRYFPTKEALLNEMYLYVLGKGWEAVSEAYDPSRPMVERAEAIWNAHIDWALAHPVWSRAVIQLAVTDILTEETRAADMARFPDAGMMEMIVSSEILEGQTPHYADALFTSIASTTIEFAMREPARVETYKTSGFKAIRRLFLD